MSRVSTDTCKRGNQGYPAREMFPRPALQETAVKVRVYNGASDKDARAAVAATGGINWELLSGSTLALEFAAGQAQKKAPQATVSLSNRGAHRPMSSSAIKKRK